MKITEFMTLGIVMLSFSGCNAVASQNATLISSKDGHEQYSINGLVRVPKVFDGCTKPYVEKGMSAMCPNGLKYAEFMETFNKYTIVGTWMQWQGVVECK